MKALSKAALTALALLLTATDSEAGFGYVAPKEADALEERGLAEVKRDMVEDGNYAARITDAGRELLSKSDTKTESTRVSAAPVAAAGLVAGVAIPEPKRAVGGRQGKFPFDQMEVGHSFFVPDVPGSDKPMAKSLASTISTANQRYAEVIEGEFRENRSGEKVPATRLTRKFEVRHMDDGAAWGEQYAGQSGAGVWRTQ